VEGARVPPNTVSIAQSRSRPMSSMQPAPAAMPSTRHTAFVTGPGPAGAAGPHPGQQPRQSRTIGEGQERRQAGVGQQVRVIEHGARPREAVQQSRMRGVLSDGPMEA